MGFAIRRRGGYLALPGSHRTVTPDLGKARVFVTYDGAEQHRLEDEAIVETCLPPTRCPYCAVPDCRH